MLLTKKEKKEKENWVRERERAGGRVMLRKWSAEASPISWHFKSRSNGEMEPGGHMRKDTPSRSNRTWRGCRRARVESLRKGKRSRGLRQRVRAAVTGDEGGRGGWGRVVIQFVKLNYVFSVAGW